MVIENPQKMSYIEAISLIHDSLDMKPHEVLEVNSTLESLSAEPVDVAVIFHEMGIPVPHIFNYASERFTEFGKELLDTLADGFAFEGRRELARHYGVELAEVNSFGELLRKMTVDDMIVLGRYAGKVEGSEFA